LLTGFFLPSFGPLQNNFGISVSTEMIAVPMRVLAAPSVNYRSNVSIKPQSGGWNMRQGSKFILVGPQSRQFHWTRLVLNFGNTEPSAQDLKMNLDELTRTLLSCGLAMPYHNNTRTPARMTRGLPWSEYIDKKSQLTTEFEQLLLQEKSIGLVYVVIVGCLKAEAPLYAAVKWMGDLRFGVNTVCSLLDKFIRNPKGQAQYLANIALKMNLKTGGTNHYVTLGPCAKDAMIVGADVTHPGPSSARYCPSIAAVVGNNDANFANYPASLRLQEGRREVPKSPIPLPPSPLPPKLPHDSLTLSPSQMIKDLGAMLAERLHSYHNASKTLPRRIIFYRDGVSESQYAAVMEQELPQIRDACRTISQHYKGPNAPLIRITLIIVGKRHHTRFFPSSRTHMDARNGNPMPGAVVDRAVTDPYDFDFFLQSHQGLRGTARPCHYYVLIDENKFDVDDLQRMTYYLSYNFARANRSVSVCTPAYYADIACERARCYLYSMLVNDRTVKPKSSLPSWAMAEARAMVDGWWAGPSKAVHERLKRTMFYL